MARPAGAHRRRKCCYARHIGGLVLSHRVLLVDDSHTMRAYACAALDADGIEVTEARTGFEAIKILPQKPFDLIITDINMPDINGLEVIRFVRSHGRYREVPVIIISTEGREEDRDRALALGADEYLVKPFSPDRLTEVVRGYLRGESVT